VTACGHPDLNGLPTTGSSLLALAASDTELGFVWQEAGTWLHFTRLRPDFTVLSDTACIGPAVSAWQVALAATPTGWLIAETDAVHATPIYLFSLDAAGILRGTLPMGVQAREVHLIQRPGGGPLLLWVDPVQFFGTEGMLHAQLVADDGVPVGAETRVAPVQPGSVTGVFTGAGFELAAEVDVVVAMDLRAIQLFYVGLDGSLRTDAHTTTHNWFASPSVIAWSGLELRLLYDCVTDAGSGTCFQRFSPSGLSVSGPSVLGGPVGGRASALAGDSHTGILREGSAEDPALGFAFETIDSSGAVVAAPQTVSRDPGTDAVQMVAQGGDAVVAWIGSDLSGLQPRLEMARVRLTP
jgi:hypothetical protein